MYRFIRQLVCVFFVMPLLMVNTHAETLYLGSIGDDPAEEIEEFQSLADYLKENLKDVGIDDVKTLVAANKVEMVSYVKQNKVDIYIDSPFPSMLIAQEAGSTIFLRRWKKGVAEYHSVIFARNDSGIDTT